MAARAASPCFVRYFLYDLIFSSPTEINSIPFTSDAFYLAMLEVLKLSRTLLNSLGVGSGYSGHDVRAASAGAQYVDVAQIAMGALRYFMPQ